VSHWCFNQLSNPLPHCIAGRGLEDYSHNIFLVEGFLYEDQIEELFIVMNSVRVFPAYNIFVFLVNSNFFNCGVFFFKARYSLVLEVSNSISHSFIVCLHVTKQADISRHDADKSALTHLVDSKTTQLSSLEFLVCSACCCHCYSRD